FEWRLVRDPDRRRQRDEQHGHLSSTPDDARTRRRRLAGNDLREGEDGPRHDHLRPSEPLRPWRYAPPDAHFSFRAIDRTEFRPSHTLSCKRVCRSPLAAVRVTREPLSSAG